MWDKSHQKLPIGKATVIDRDSRPGPRPSSKKSVKLKLGQNLRLGLLLWIWKVQYNPIGTPAWNRSKTNSFLILFGTDSVHYSERLFFYGVQKQFKLILKISWRCKRCKNQHEKYYSQPELYYDFLEIRICFQIANVKCNTENSRKVQSFKQQTCLMLGTLNLKCTFPV